jgi:hypothetical protein
MITNLNDKLFLIKGSNFNIKYKNMAFLFTILLYKHEFTWSHVAISCMKLIYLNEHTLIQVCLLIILFFVFINVFVLLYCK